VAYSLPDFHATRTPITGVRDARRLRAVAEADLPGHLGDPDLDAVVETLRLASGSPIAVVNIVTADVQTYPAEVGVGAACTSVPDALSFCAEVVDTGKPLLVTDAASHPVYSRNPLVLQGTVGAYAGVPLIDQGVVLGSVSIFDSGAREFPPDVLSILGYQAGLAASVLALRRSARTDGLTGLPNRALFGDRLDRALTRLDRHPGMICVMYVDIDNFKSINDTHGHPGGDQVLVELGVRLASVMRLGDTVARFGGDEFVVLCEDLKSAAAAEEMATRIIAAATEPWVIQGKTMSVDVSIGFAVTASSTADAEALLRDADDAMYLAKAIRGSASVKSVGRGSIEVVNLLAG
jgi:diguanylate cyclase (GGDEF)-like protein